MRQNQGDGVPEVFQAFFTRRALTIGSRDLGAIGNVPWTVLLDNCREFVAHNSILPPAGAVAITGQSPHTSQSQSSAHPGRGKRSMHDQAPLNDDDPYEAYSTLRAQLFNAGVKFAIARFSASFWRNLPYHASHAGAASYLVRRVLELAA